MGYLQFIVGPPIISLLIAVAAYLLVIGPILAAVQNIAKMIVQGRKS